MIEKSVKELDFGNLCNRTFHPSPSNWADEVLYFLLLDRFSDGLENLYLGNDGILVKKGTTPPYDPSENANAVQTAADAARWQTAGQTWAGGTLSGLTTKIGYLKRLGITCLWVSPIFKQTAYHDTYHGYGIQNFLDVDPHFGSREDLRKMVETAHENGLRVILDIVFNHAGDVFEYDPDRYWTEDKATGRQYMDPRWDGNGYATKGFKDKTGQPSLLPLGPLISTPDAWPDSGVWPAELQQPGTFTCKGRISNWDHNPEYLEGDFYDLKDIALGYGSTPDYRPSAALDTICEVYKFWVAYADLDGFRVDTVKHMDHGAARYFNAVIHEFAQSIGKENFFLVAEITGGREKAFDTLEVTGMDAALGIDEIPGRFEAMLKGAAAPAEYFDLFRDSFLFKKDSHQWFLNKVVTMVDDHDQVGKGQNKARFCAYNPQWAKMMLPALALNLTTMGIPCVYYGSEQCFDGEGGSDRYLREAMFGGEFGAFRSRGFHFFNEDHHVYKELSKIAALRTQYKALRRGRQYLRPISGDGQNFGYPAPIGGRLLSVVPWSRLFAMEEMLLAINTDPDNDSTASIMVDYTLNRAKGAAFKCLYSTRAADIGQITPVIQPRSYLCAMQITLPPAGFVIYQQQK